MKGERMVRFVAVLVLGAIIGCGSFRAADSKADTPSDAGAATPDAPGPSTFSTAIDNLDGVIAHWRLDDTGTVAADRVGANDGTYSAYFGRRSLAPSLLVDDPTNGATLFIDANPKGASVKVDEGALASGLKSLGTRFTIGAVIKPTMALGHPAGIITAGSAFDMWLDNGTPRFTLHGTPTEITSDLRLAKDTNHLLVAVFDGTKVVLFVDGARKEAAHSAAVGTVSGPLCIASIAAGGDCGSNAFEGVVDEVFIASAAATELQLATLLRYVRREP